MAVGRGAARFATVFMLFAGLVAAGATPASAEGEGRVSLQAPNTFTAGTPRQLSVSVSKRGKDCVAIRTTLEIEMPGLAANLVRVEADLGGSWQPLGVSGGSSGTVTTTPVTPDRPMVCEKKNAGVHYRVTFLAGGPSGTATFVAQANSVYGELARNSHTSNVVGRRSASPTPTAPEPTSPTPAVVDDQTVTTPTPALAGPPPAKSDDGGGFGIGTLVMVLGVGMVGVGIALLVLLLRRSRAAGTDQPASGGFPPAQGGFPPAQGGYPAGGPTPYPSGFPGTGPYPPPASSGGDATAIMPRLPH